jgi:hypothetical protein
MAVFHRLADGWSPGLGVCSCQYGVSFWDEKWQRLNGSSRRKEALTIFVRNRMSLLTSAATIKPKGPERLPVPALIYVSLPA